MGLWQERAALPTGDRPWGAPRGSLGLFWKPIFSVLEEAFTGVLVNAAQGAQVSGRRMEVKDCAWIGQLLEHGLVWGQPAPHAPRGLSSSGVRHLCSRFSCEAFRSLEMVIAIRTARRTSAMLSPSSGRSRRLKLFG